MSSLRNLDELVAHARKPLNSTLQALPEEAYGGIFDYPRKSRLVTWALWFFTGFLGGHRLYLGRVGTAMIMFVTGGGLLIWWIVDLFLLNGMVREQNEEQARREREGLPPMEFSAMGPIDRASLARPPEWARPERRWPRGILTDAAVLMLTGLMLGVVSRETGDYKGMAVVAGMVFMLNLPAGLYRWRDLPLVGDLVEWDLRLHAFYHNHSPGSGLSRLARPITGWVTSIFRPRNWTETRLYLQLGIAASMFFGAVDLTRDVAAPYLMQGVVVNPLTAWIEGTVLTLTVIFFFTVPIGATLVKCSLLDRPRGEAWALSALSAVAVLFGLVAGGG